MKTLLYNTNRRIQDAAKKTKFILRLRLCTDVFVDILRCANRRQLALLESAGKRFQFLMESGLYRKPYLVFEIGIGIKNSKLHVKITITILSEMSRSNTR